MPQVQGVTLMGLLSEQVPKLSNYAISMINTTQAPFLLVDTVAEFSQAQLQSLYPNSFASLTDDTIYGIPPTHVPWISNQQLDTISGVRPQIFNRMPCDQIYAFTPEQHKRIDDGPAETNYEQRKAGCGAPGPGPGPQPGPPGPKPPGPQPPGPAPGPMSVSAEIAIGVGVGAIVFIAVAVAVYIWKTRKVSTSMYIAVPESELVTDGAAGVN